MFEVQSSVLPNAWLGTLVELPILIEPTFWQSWTFRVTCVGAGLLCTLALYKLRTRYLLQQANARSEAQHAERIRIARELHDTLLQGLDSAALQLGVVASAVSERSPVRSLLDHALQTMEHVSGEARDSLRGLRSGSGDNSRLEDRFRSKPAEVADMAGIRYLVRVEGASSALQPPVLEEVFLIGQEAILNACRHAQASSIEVRVAYQPGHLALGVIDDGLGIDPPILRAGKLNHWGLIGMRERAKRIGATLTLTSTPNEGARVFLTVPADVAYPERSKKHFLRVFLRLLSKS